MSDDEKDTGGERGEAVLDLSNQDVTTKYRAAADIVDAALRMVVDKCLKGDGVSVVEICRAGDEFIEAKASGIFNKKEKNTKKPIEKGTAFPTCISVNEICGHFSPLESESVPLKKGDIAKIDMACHIDGYICVAGHTVVVGAADGSPSEPVSGRKGDAIRAAWTAAEAALRMVEVGKKNSDVTSVMNKAVAEFNCNMVQGVLSHQMKRHAIDCNRCIISKETLDDKVEDFEFGLNEVYGIDVIVSTGEGKPKPCESCRTTVLKRALDTQYSLKTPLARTFISEINRRFPTLPFSLSAIKDEKMARRGVIECTRHELLHAYPVLREKTGEYVAQFKFTVLLLPGGAKKVTGLPLDESASISEFTVKDEELQKLLAASANPKKKKKKAKAELKELVNAAASSSSPSP